MMILHIFLRDVLPMASGAFIGTWLALLTHDLLDKK